jgi:hypothetical protein
MIGYGCIHTYTHTHIGVGFRKAWTLIGYGCIHTYTHTHIGVGFRKAWTLIGYGCILASFTVFIVAVPDKATRQKLKENM